MGARDNRAVRKTEGKSTNSAFRRGTSGNNAFGGGGARCLCPREDFEKKKNGSLSLTAHVVGVRYSRVVHHFHRQSDVDALLLDPYGRGPKNSV